MENTAAVVEQPQVEAPVQDTAAEPQAPTAEPQPERRAPLTKQGAFESARQRARELFTPREEPATETVATEAGPKEPVVDARGRKHDPATGEFLPSGEEAPAEDGGGEEAPAAEAQPPEAEVAEPEAAPEEPHGVRIELPEGDIRRIAGGRDSVTVSKEAEPLVRWSINNHVRRAEVEAERQARKEIEKQLLRLRAEQSASSEWEQTPEYKAAATEYREIFESVRDRLIDQGTPEQDAIEAAKARADKYWQGVAAPQLKAFADQKYQEQVSQVEEVETQKAAEAWVNEAWSNMTTQLPREIREIPQFRQWFEAAITAFDAEIAAGQHPDVKTPEDAHREFKALFEARLVRQPAVVEVLRRRTRPTTPQQNGTAPQFQPRPQNVKTPEQAVEEFKRQVAEKRRATPPHPMGNLAPVSTTGPAVSRQDEPLPAHLTGQSAKRAAIERAGKRAAKWFGT